MTPAQRRSVDYLLGWFGYGLDFSVDDPPARSREVRVTRSTEQPVTNGRERLAAIPEAVGSALQGVVRPATRVWVDGREAMATAMAAISDARSRLTDRIGELSRRATPVRHAEIPRAEDPVGPEPSVDTSVSDSSAPASGPVSSDITPTLELPAELEACLPLEEYPQEELSTAEPCEPPDPDETRLETERSSSWHDLLTRLFRRRAADTTTVPSILGAGVTEVQDDTPAPEDDDALHQRAEVLDRLERLVARDTLAESAGEDTPSPDESPQTTP